MKVSSVRFGILEVATSDMIRFPSGLLGMQSLRDWALLDDLGCDSLAWLQSVDCAEIAFAVVNPRCFVPNYQICLPRCELEPLGSDKVESLTVVTLVSKTEDAITLNLKAPLVINPPRQLGLQVISGGDLPIRHELESTRASIKKIA